jgi:D-alanyl-D-alanine carboxypeptidase
MGRVLLILVLIAIPLSAQAKIHPQHVHHKLHKHSHIANYNIQSSSILIDIESGKVLESDAANEKRYPASLTKMMTLYLAFDAIDSEKLELHQTTIVSRYASKQAPSVINLRPNERIKIESLILAIVTKSANDAAVALGETIGGTESNFARMMTEKAHALGMENTIFKNASGLPNPDQHTTAHDMAILGMALWNHHRKYYHYFSTNHFSWHNREYPNHNHILIEYKGADGIKTGFINASGFNLVASASRNGRRLVGVVFGGTTHQARDQKMIRLLDYGFNRTE